MMEGGNTSKVTMRSKKYTYLPSRPSDEGCERTKQAFLEKAWDWGGRGDRAAGHSGKSQVSPIGKEEDTSENKLRIKEILVIMNSEL